jgi:large subunit ribosomal protein L6
MSTEEGVVRVEIPEGVDAMVDEELNVTVRGPLGEVKRKFGDPRAFVSREGNAITISVASNRRKSLAMLNTYRAHFKNMFKGVTEGFTYEMQIVYSHFPMRVNVKENEVLIQNFLGERAPRKAKISEGVKVEVKGDKVILRGVDKEKVGQSAANIERATKIRRRDPRVFQDGIYILGGAR